MHGRRGSLGKWFLNTSLHMNIESLESWNAQLLTSLSDIRICFYGGSGGLMVKTRASNLESQGSSPASVRAFFFSLSLCLTSIPWSSLRSTLSNEEVFHCILRRGCKAVSPGGPGLISLRLFWTLVSQVNPKETIGWENDMVNRLGI